MSEFNGILTVTVFPARVGSTGHPACPSSQSRGPGDPLVCHPQYRRCVHSFTCRFPGLRPRRWRRAVHRHLGWLSAETIKSSYLLGVDGLSAPLVLLTGILGLAAAFASRNIGLRVSEYFIWLLLLESAVMGVFVSLDLLLFFVFFEFEVIPMFMLISVWGSGRPRYSAMKFVTLHPRGRRIHVRRHLRPSI